VIIFAPDLDPSYTVMRLRWHLTSYSTLIYLQWDGVYWWL